ncbi:MAG TPA: aminotransferase class V-fold PLP-dependent enzyme [Gemmatimonadales bacterium]|nr:aminotransferase class V-fold PLP-dependent enzyme [Gemmatimonadales bacterium]
MVTRRHFLTASGLAGFGLVARPLAPPGTAVDQDPKLPPLNRPTGPAATVARDEAYWARVRAHYRVANQFTNLEAGYYGMMALPVLAEFHRHIDRVNLESSHYARRRYETDLEAARARVAQLVGAQPAEIAFTRGATEALHCLIAQYNRLRPGDTVLYADVDYMAMQHTMNWLAERRGVTVARFDLPEPASHETVLAAYERALAQHPRTRLLLLTHLNNKSGLILPAKQIVELARVRGADVIVDAAHSFGQLDITLSDLGADFVGFNLHKWLGAPIGAGVMYIKEGRLPDIDRMYGDETNPAGSIKSRIHTGTAHFATYLTVPAALDFHAAVGPAYKAARVRYLRDRWVAQVRATPEIDVLTLDDPATVAAITSFRIRKRGSREANQAVVTELVERYGLFTAWRTGLAGGDCVRVTPALYNSPADADRLAAALKEIAGRG